MGFLSDIKKSLFGEDSTPAINLDSYLTESRTSLRQAQDSLTKFLNETKDFRAARRHEQLFAESIHGRISLMRAWIAKSVDFLDERMNNTINTNSSVKSTEQLSKMIADWIKVLKTEQQAQVIPDSAQKDVMVFTSNQSEPQNDKLPEDVIGILKTEIWDDKLASRGFPIPKNKELLYNYLETAYLKLKETKSSLDTYNLNNITPEN